MSQQDVDVKVTVDPSGAKSGAEGVAQAAGKVKQSWGDGFKQLGEDAGKAVEGMAARIKSALSPIAGLFDNINQSFKTLATAFVAFQAFKEVVNIFNQVAEAFGRTADYGDELIKTAQKTGIAVDSLAELGYIAKLSDSSLSELARSVNRMAVNVSKAGDEGSNSAKVFKALGIETRNASGELRAPIDILGDVADAFSKMEDGANKVAIATAIGGRGFVNLIPLLNQGRDKMRELANEAREMGLVIGEETARKNEEFNDSLTKLGQVAAGLWYTFSNQIIPILRELVESLADTLKDSDLLKDSLWLLGKVLGALAAAILIVVNAIGILIEVLDALYEGVKSNLTALGGALAALMRGDFQGAVDILGQNANRVEKIWDTMLANVRKKGEEVGRALRALLGMEEPKAEGGTGEGSDIGGDGGAASRGKMEVWQDELRAQIEATGDYLSDTTELEVQFWEKHLGMVRKGSNEELAIRQRLYGLRRSLAQQNQQEIEQGLEEERTARDESLQLERDQALNSIQMKQENLRAQRQLERISEEQEVAGMQQLELEKYQMELRTLQRQADIYEQGTQQRKRYLKEIEQLQRRHQAEMNRLQNQATNAQANSAKKAAKNQETLWKGIMGPIRNAISGSVMGILQGTQTAMGAVRNFLTGLLASMIDTLAQMLEQWILNMILGKTTASVESVTSGVGQVMNNAAVSASGAYSATAMIPYVGPILAPAAAATAYAATAAYAGMILPFAEKGYDVPGDTMAFLHKREMVLPANIADTVRGMAEGGGGGGGGSVNNYTIQAIDAAGVKKFFQRHAREMAKTTSRQMQDNPNTRLKY